MRRTIISSFSLYLFSIVYAVYFRSTLKVAVKRPGCFIECVTGQMKYDKVILTSWPCCGYRPFRCEV